MYKLLSKNGLMYAWLAGIVVVAISLVIIGMGLPEDATVETLKKSAIFDFALKATAFLFILAAALAVLMPLVYLAKNPKSALVGLLGVGALLVVFLIFRYGFSSTEVTDAMYKFNVKGGTGAVIDGAIKTTIFLAVGSLVVLFVSEVLSFFK